MDRAIRCLYSHLFRCPRNGSILESHSPISAKYITIIRLYRLSLIEISTKSLGQGAIYLKLRSICFPSIEPCINNHILLIIEASNVWDLNLVFPALPKIDWLTIWQIPTIYISKGLVASLKRALYSLPPVTEGRQTSRAPSRFLW